jgi:hypothetical protein
MTCGRALVVLLLIAGLLATPAARQSQENETPAPFALDDLLALMAAGVTPVRLTTLVKERGVTFDFTPEAEQKLRLAGADDALLLEVAKASARRSPPPKPAPKPEPPPAPVDRTKLVVDKAIEALGGLSVLESYHRGTIVVLRSTVFTPQGQTSYSGTVYVAPDKLRFDWTSPSRSSFIYDGQRAWSQVGDKVTDLPPIEAEITRRRLAEDPDQLLLGVSQDRYSAQYLETRTIEGRETDVLGVINGRGEQVKLFVESSTGRVLRSVAPELISSGETVECETHYSDFRRIGAYTLPFRHVAWHNGVRSNDVVYQSVQFDSPLDSALFARPERRRPLGIK